MEQKEFKCLRAFINAVHSYVEDGYIVQQRDQWIGERLAVLRHPKTYKLINIHADIRNGVLREYLNGVLVFKTTFK